MRTPFVHHRWLVRALLLLGSVLGAGWAQSDTLAGTFGDGRVTLTLRAIGGGQYTGDITVDGATYQLSAIGSPHRIEGSFVAAGASFAFHATLAADVVTLVSGGNTFSLARRDGARPSPLAATDRAIARGTRLSYHHAAVTHAGTDAGPDVRSVGGRGITQFTIHHIDDRLCVMTVSTFVQGADGAGPFLDPFGGSTVVGRDGTCPDVWWPPERLDAYAAPPGTQQRVSRGPLQFTEGGATLHALHVREELAGTRFANAWDLASGVLLSATDGTGPVPAPAREATSSSSLTLIDARATPYPWDVTAPLPTSVQALTELRFEGTLERTFVGVTSPPHAERFEIVLDVAERLPSLLLLRIRGGGDGAYAVLAPTGALFVPPAAVAVLRGGQRIDDDPATGSSLSVERSGAEGIVLTVTGPGLTIRSSYDPATGLLASERVEVDDGVTRTVIETRLTSAR